MTLSSYLAEVKSKTEALPKLPYKVFPLVYLGEFRDEPNEQAEIMNKFMQFGYSVVPDVETLLKIVEMQMKAIEILEPVPRHYFDCLYCEMANIPCDNCLRENYSEEYWEKVKEQFVVRKQTLAECEKLVQSEKK